MAQLLTQYANRATPLVNKTFVSCTAGGDTFGSGDNIFLAVKNGSGSAVTVTVATPGNVDGIDLEGYEFTVPSMGATDVGPFPEDLFGSQAAVTYSAVATLTIAVTQYGD